MRYNTTYIPQVDLIETIKSTNFVVKEIYKYFTRKFKSIEVTVPPFLSEDSELLINIDEITRPITFDFGDEYKTAQLLLSTSNWMRDMFNKLNLEIGSSLIAQNQMIWRDLPDTTISTAFKKEITVQVSHDENDDIEKIIKNYAQDFYSFLEKIETTISEKHNIKKHWPKFGDNISSQQMENEFPNSTIKEREIDVAHELNCYIMKNPSKKLFSGHIHTYLPPEIYSQNNFYVIVCKDFINTSVLKVASISLLASGTELDDQLKYSNKEYLKERSFYTKLIKEKNKIIEFKINIGKLIYIILKKGHISEVIPGVISDESKIIESRYKVKKY